MTDAVTIHYSWAYPTVNADADTWGTTLNNALIAVDASLFTVDTAVAGKLAKASNLSDVASAGAARTNLGIGSIGTFAAQGAQPFAATVSNAFISGHFCFFASDGGIADSNTGVGSFLQTSNNLSDVVAATARTNLGLGSIATHKVTISSSAPSGGSDGDIWLQYIP